MNDNSDIIQVVLNVIHKVLFTAVVAAVEQADLPTVPVAASPANLRPPSEVAAAAAGEQKKWAAADPTFCGSGWRLADPEKRCKTAAGPLGCETAGVRGLLPS
jgi:hypothetical protein